MAVTRKKVAKTAPGQAIKKQINSRGSTSGTDGLWWLAEHGKVHEALMQTVKSIREDTRGMSEQMLTFFRMYDGRYIAGWQAHQYLMTKAVSQPEDHITWNVVQSAIDTVTSKIAKNKPAPMFLTENGRFNQRRRAKKLTQFVRGVFYMNKAYELGPKVFRTACIGGTGTWHVYASGSTPKIEYVFPNENLIDPEESFYGAPRNRYRVKVLPKLVVAAMWPDKANKIMEADPVPHTRGRNVGEHIEVTEAWHLPACGESPESEKGDGTGGSKDEKNAQTLAHMTKGRRVIAIAGCDLEDEEWERGYFPFVDFHWSAPLIGSQGRGISAEIAGIQREINRGLWLIHRSQRMFGFPVLLSPKSAQISERKISNLIGQIWEYLGDKAPQVVTSQTVHQEIYAHIERLFEKAFQIVGVSVMAATSQKPAGIESGVALREVNDIETERFMTVGQAYEQFYVDTSRHVIDVMREIEKRNDGKKLSVPSADRRRLAMIDWADAKMDEAEYVTQVYPVSSLPSTPAGRFQAVMERLQAGFIDQQTALRLLDSPDISAEDNVELAMLEDIDWTIENILDGKDVPPPDPMQNLELGIRRMHAAALNAKRDGAPEELIDKFRDWITAASDLLKERALAAQPVQDPAAITGPAAAPAPGSDALPTPSGGEPPAAPPLVS